MRRDIRPFLYGGLDLLFAAVYVYLLTSALPNRHLWAQVLLFGLPVFATIMAVGTIAGGVLKKPEMTRIAWIVAVVGGAGMVVVTVTVLALLLMSAAFLAGVYGAFGKGAAMGVLGGAAVVVELCGLLPAFQLKYLMTRAGRRAFGLAPLWRAA